ncbi:LA_0442/LA_0875 N-terminal domain-containing protein [Leptospira jelokensis]|uniref:LA_0442/LA_0875 N-terminal domain-containing protein n=1 Tax=Leptospira jelokensis TaxID=2484931 RepID=UPI003CC53B24
MLLRLFIFSVFYLLSSSAVFSTNVLLKSGGVIKGRVVNQYANQLIIIDETGISRTIQKSNAFL